MVNDETNTPEMEQDENQNHEGQENTENNEDQDNQDQDQEDKTDWKAEALKYKAILDRNKNKKSENKEPAKKSDGLDYGSKAFLTANGIKGSKEFEFVQNELKQSGEELEALLENDYFKSRLEKFRNLNKTEEATPTGKRGNGVPTDSVDYWMSKPISEVPKDMRIKVVNAKIEKEKSSKGTFYNS